MSEAVLDDGQIISRTPTKEIPRERRTSFGLFYNSTTVDSIVDQVKAASINDPLDTAVVSEYAITIEQAIDGFSSLIGLARQTGTNIVLAADARSYRKTPEDQRLDWSGEKTQILQKEGVIQDEDSEKPVDDSVGFFFGRDGNTYVFPKWTTSLHIIPETNVAVAICGEIGHLSGETIKQVDVAYIFNPSREGDDPFLSLRMMGLSDIKDEDFLRLYVSSFAPEEVVLDYSKPDEVFAALWKQQKNQLTVSREEYIQNWIKVYSAQLTSARENSRATSMYARNITDELNTKKILVIRSDGRKSLGILNPFSGLRVDNANFQRDFMTMSVTID